MKNRGLNHVISWFLPLYPFATVENGILLFVKSNFKIKSYQLKAYDDALYDLRQRFFVLV